MFAIFYDECQLSNPMAPANWGTFRQLAQPLQWLLQQQRISALKIFLAGEEEEEGERAAKEKGGRGTGWWRSVGSQHNLIFHAYSSLTLPGTLSPNAEKWMRDASGDRLNVIRADVHEQTAWLVDSLQLRSLETLNRKDMMLELKAKLQQWCADW